MARRARRRRNVIKLVTTTLVDTVRNVEAAVVDDNDVASGRSAPAMARPMCCESVVCQSA
jgi:hypothetical protein